MTQAGKRGRDLLLDPVHTHSTAYTEEQKQALGLVGLVPDVTETIDNQLKRVFMQLGHKNTDIDRYIYLVNLLDHNETLFYKTIMSDPARFLPIIYDPTIGEACLKFGHIFRHPRGVYLSIERRGRVREVLRNWPEKDVRFICVTNGGRILGLGDLGANGMGIPIGKLQLYTAAAGVPPHGLLPMFLDAGTNNAELLADPLYLGLRRRRLPTEELYSFVDEFVAAVQEVFPGCCIHFEDWTGVDAVHLLERYRDKVCCYNDDVQGTAGITLAGVINACRAKGTKLADESFLFLGAGSAGIGLANLLCAALVDEGLTLEEARGRVRMFDVVGLLESSRSDLVDFQKPYAHAHAPMPRSDFAKAVEEFRPTVLIGVSTMGGAFDKDVVEAMSRVNDQPVILALSNPTEKAECTAEQAYAWSGGKALYAAGVQFSPVSYGGRTFLPGQANNFYIFPAVGMAIYATKAKRVTDRMFIRAARAVAGQVTDAQLAQGLLYPLQSDILETEIKTAATVAGLVFDDGLATVDRPADMEAYIRSLVYAPQYAS
ncbi:Malate dehydrogenase (oxaloacetate-decarboxylating) (NADP(+)) [Solidesulfovibrio fructosivorans JJ]]|uniref:Malate dehydrogenase (Oxaloacetate-decarboxylating) (NADP(+)) n=2 Tax=Solidesulfovibrio fructosivorans TaxID=878 RepID=E1JUD9_SOLFR|nr:Malate dehydrogenase (oxaloacetate-decarboxylating) (NADP(+)) [Solidesulfovibrio fructosivorans JJ]]